MAISCDPAACMTWDGFRPAPFEAQPSLLFRCHPLISPTCAGIVSPLMMDYRQLISSFEIVSYDVCFFLFFCSLENTACLR